MRIGFYVMRADDRCHVRREVALQGIYDSWNSALMSALFMASIDGEQADHGAEVFIEDISSRLRRTFSKGDCVVVSRTGQPSIVRMGDKRVRQMVGEHILNAPAARNEQLTQQIPTLSGASGKPITRTAAHIAWPRRSSRSLPR